MAEQYSWFFEPRHFAFNPDTKTDYILNWVLLSQNTIIMLSLRQALL